MTTTSPFASAQSPTLPAPTTIGRRIGAYLIDAAIQGIIVGIAAVIASFVVLGGASSGDASAALVALLTASAIVFVVALAVVVGYTLMQGGGGSVGQRLLGLRLADAATGARIGFGRALVRNIIWGLAGSIVVGYFSPLFDASPRRQGWHDRVARAFVATARTAAPEYTPAPAPAAPVAPAAPIAAAVVGPPPRFAPSAQHAATTPPMFPSRAPAPGLISFVPGVDHPGVAPAPDPFVFDDPAFDEPGFSELGFDDPDFDPVALEATELVRAPVASSASVAPSPDRPADDATVAAPPRRRVVVALTWDTGERVAVYGTTLFGRNPAAEPGAAVIAVRDETLSLSKTHFEIGADDQGPWVSDRHSTNGTLLVRAGDRRPLPPGVPTPLVAGDRLEFGDRSLLVGDDS